jgi:general secretion pathway protein L
MLDRSQQWHLFGYDMRRIGHHWQVAWAEFLWGERSPVRARLDDIVSVEGEEGGRCYHAGVPVTAGEATCRAICLPDALVLFRTLTLPRAAEDELQSVMQLEVAANSPFPASDTAAGWSLVERSDRGLQVELAIVSRSAAMRYLGQRYDIHDVHAREIWALAGDRPIVLRGFGEGERLARYQRRLLRIATLLGGGLLLLLLILALAAGGKYLELQQYEALAARVEQEAAEVTRQRESLSAANQTIIAVNDYLREYPDPHTMLALLTRLLGDDAHVAQFTLRGLDLRLRGRAQDGAGVVQALTRQPEFEEVADQGIAAVGNTGFEQFNVNIRLREVTP